MFRIVSGECTDTFVFFIGLEAHAASGLQFICVLQRKRSVHPCNRASRCEANTCVFSTLFGFSVEPIGFNARFISIFGAPSEVRCVMSCGSNSMLDGMHAPTSGL